MAFNTGSLSGLEEELAIKHSANPTVMFPAHAYGRGGIGHFLAAGHSRAGLHRLPKAAQRAANTSISGRSSRTSSGRSTIMDGDQSMASGFSLLSADPASSGAAREWEKGSVQHPR